MNELKIDLIYLICNKMKNWWIIIKIKADEKKRIEEKERDYLR